jgi:CubicO group peptidase (beta-lactamase class C family)/acetylornithine deacetylase/succinyl-diaminopimelate desuccinylase-like protein
MRTTAAAVVTSVLSFATVIPGIAGTAQTGAPGNSGVPGINDTRARAIFKELIEINTTDSVGSTTKAADAMAARLKAAGFTDVQVLGPDPRKGNLVLRWRGTSSAGARRPLLLLAHLDVVEAKREDWSFDPFVFLEKDGYFYGRGTSDDKAMAAQFVANLIRLKEEGYTPDRDLILALTADEEGGNFNGVDWLLTNHRDLIDAEFAINEGGGGNMRKGKYLTNEVQASEKVFQDFRLEVTNPGGHSSLPVKDNAIYHLSEGLARLAKFDFPVQLNEVTRAYFERSASVESDPKVAADMRAVARATPDLAAASRLSAAVPYWNSMMRTTCVATRLAAGHANNALPQLASANVNCRILPGVSPASVRDKLVELLADPAITVSFVGEANPSKPSPLRPDVMSAVESLTREMFPGVVVVPVMSTGATDGLYLRNGEIPTYGIDGTFGDMDDVRAHGRDERVGVKQFFEGLDFQYRLIKILSSASNSSAASQPGGSNGATPRPSREARPVETKPARVDEIFSRFTTSESPGCALAVVQNGKIAYERGYGRASLELDVPITPQTVFDIGSTSKQFTAFSLLLLERDGKLSLDDDIRKYLPEVPDYGNRITIRHLLAHTSGLRDYTDLLGFDGHDTADSTDDRDALDLIARQRGVNFAPGEEWRYSNTGFFLASIIVRRASGQSLASFARERIFQPLGMTSTQFLDDTTRVVPKRATAYSPRQERQATSGGGFRVNMSDWNQTGDGAVQTTVEDLAHWDENFYTPRVGDARMLQAMQTPGRLNNGKAHDYGLGLTIGSYGGQKRVSHGGSWAGYRAELMRFPERHTSIITLCNVSNSGPTALAESVAAVWLADAGLTPPAPRATAPAPPAPPSLSDDELRAHAGRYASPELTLPWIVELVDHQLRVRIRKGSGDVLTPVSRDEFRWSGTRITFERDALVITNRGVEKLRLTRTTTGGS